MADQIPAAEAAKKKLPEYDKALADKYEISPVLQPAKVDLGARFGRIEVDLRNPESLAVIDDFVKKFEGKQNLFTLKSKLKTENPTGSK